MADENTPAESPKETIISDEVWNLFFGTPDFKYYEKFLNSLEKSREHKQQVSYLLNKYASLEIRDPSLFEIYTPKPKAVKKSDTGQYIFDYGDRLVSSPGKNLYNTQPRSAKLIALAKEMVRDAYNRDWRAIEIIGDLTMVYAAREAAQKLKLDVVSIPLS